MNKLRQPMRRHGRLGLPLVIGLLLSGGLMAADYLPDGADGGFIRLRDAECENATALTVVLHPAGVAADRAPLSPRLVIPRRESGGWVVYVGGWPPGLEGACDLELRCTPDGAVIRLPAALARTPRRMDVALLLDDSHSMRTTDPQRLRVAAARLFAQMAAARGDIRTLSLIAFNQRARLLLPPTPPGDSEAVETALGQLEAAGATDLDRAFALAAAQFETLPPSRKVAIVLSDGRDEPGAYTFGHRRFSAHRWPVHTIGLSEAIDEATLRMIAASTGGSYHRAGNTAALARIFHEIASALHTSVKIGEWTIDDRTTHPLPVDDSISVLSLALLDTSDAAASCSLRSPDGLSRALSTIWAPDAFADIFAPAAGTWHASGSSPGARLAVSASSSLDVVPFPLPARAAADAPLPVAVFVRHQDALLHPDRVDVRLSGGPPLPLRDDGMSADGDADDGIFGGYIPLDGRARARLAFEAAGTTAAGHRYQRLAYREVITQSAGETAPLLDRTIPPAQPAMGAAERLPATSLRRHASPGISTTRLQERVRGKSHDDGSAGPGIVALEPAHAPLPPASAPAAGPLLPMELTLLPVPGASDTTLSRYNAAAIITLLLAILLLLWLITRWTARPRLQPGGLAPFLLASLLLHVLLGILVMDFFIHTRIITAEQISPALAVRLEAVEASLGIALTPPGPAVPLREQASDAVLAKASLEPAAAPTHVPEPPLARPDTHAATETDHAPIPDPATPPPPDPVPLDDVLARTAVKAPAIPQAPAAAAEAVALDAPEPAGGDAAPAQEAPAPLTVARVVPSTTAP
ncbi:MAG: VWA domain-containing protein, partial [Lentisphaerae bacterium]|nr:VWA domain-containing protein [Lentisphaerota bacterium]